MTQPTRNFCNRTRREFLWEAGAGVKLIETLRWQMWPALLLKSPTDAMASFPHGES